jgi:Mor family transcriptional regulator
MNEQKTEFCIIDGMKITASDLPGELRDFAEKISFKAAMQFVEHFGGVQFYIPNIKIMTSKIRQKLIKKDSRQGMPVKEIARKYNLSVVRIYEIIKVKERPNKKADGEL